MRWQNPLVFSLLLALVGSAGFLTLRGLGYWRDAASSLGHIKEVPAGHQEIAWLFPATNAEGWERLLSALKILERDWPELHGSVLQLDLTNAFPPRSAAVPEVGVRFGDNANTLWIRWYKLSGLKTSRHWIAELHERPTPPLAILGGDTTDRAHEIADQLKNPNHPWPAGAAPLFLITTATADRFLEKSKNARPTDIFSENYVNWTKLMSVYPDRSFRYSFTNNRMAEALLSFLQAQPDIWIDQGRNKSPISSNYVRTQVLAQAVPIPFPFLPVWQPFPVRRQFQTFALRWLDDGYSRDMVEAFGNRLEPLFPHFAKDVFPPVDFEFDSIDFSVGDFYQPNPKEIHGVNRFLDRLRLSERPMAFALPTGVQRARRVAHHLARLAPVDARRVVLVNGDAISFNNVLRDRNFAWNVQDIPIPLVFFSHRDPSDPQAGFDANDPQKRTSTQDLLLFRDLAETLFLAAFDGGRLLEKSDDVLARLRETTWHEGRVSNRLVHPAAQNARRFFDDEGNRSPGTGEFIVLLKPFVETYINYDEADLSCWYFDANDPNPRWKLLREYFLLYNRGEGPDKVKDVSPR